jgi:transposase-like protein
LKTYPSCFKRYLFAKKSTQKQGGILMPPTATLDDIKAYQNKVEKNQIIPDDLPSCPRCQVSSSFFKIHAFRERRLLIIVDMLVDVAYCALIRFKCPGCNKTITYYPDFALP